MLRPHVPVIPREPRDVWAFNLEDEIALIQETAIHYPYVAMNTVFPGVVGKVLGDFDSGSELVLQEIIANVNLMNMLQLGITLLDEQGNLPPKCCSWQINFRIDLAADTYSQSSLDLLRSTGFDPLRNERDGVSHEQFASLLTCSNLVLSDDVTWITFGGGFNMAYLLKILLGEYLPYNSREYFENLFLYFPQLYDVRYLADSVKNLKGELLEISEHLKIPRMQGNHSAGSNSYLAGMAFFRMRQSYFEGVIDEKFNGVQHLLEGAMPLM
ncbi:hypothetical protein PTSG_02773 [Salpingoeca rosetta]|uniref:Uncharacterized protein n=1 Tax=Salpingoeca rosetta (strain ATCC 50818 / BSB-021) TaxID=946362 RepID=F2U399_SALR5|nr:uncharacterized protein PTSG_02773 [Salpingoeca rosetta]EGD82093.1 hypothetical protein PTSG_02773 [Salpingoeca rosetta]|eukprot:XP_004996276.1 hypothetical protein PTSG_02773 [Salpingoeca rosetta]